MTLRRSQNLVDHEVQTTLAWRVFLHWTTFLGACALGTLIWTRFIEAPTETWNYVLRDWGSHFLPFAIIAISLVPLFLRDTIKLSNRFAGPIIRVRRTLSDLADGKRPAPLLFRKGDFWQSLQHDMNRLISSHDEQPEVESSPTSTYEIIGSTKNHA